MQLIQDGKLDPAAAEAFFQWGEELDKMDIDVPQEKRDAIAPGLEELRDQLPPDQHEAWERLMDIVLKYNALSAQRKAN